MTIVMAYIKKICRLDEYEMFIVRGIKLVAIIMVIDLLTGLKLNQDRYFFLQEITSVHFCG